MSIDEILNMHAGRKETSDDKWRFYLLCEYGADAKQHCVYLPPKEPRTNDEVAECRAKYRRYKRELGWYNGFPVEGSIVLDLNPFFIKAKNGRDTLNVIAIQRKVAEIRSREFSDGGEFVGDNKERIYVSVVFDKAYTVHSDSDFGDFTNIVFNTDDEHHSNLEWLQRNYSEETVRGFFRGGGTFTLIGTVKRQYVKFGRKYTRVKNCDVLNKKGTSLHNYAEAVRQRKGKSR